MSENIGFDLDEIINTNDETEENQAFVDEVKQVVKFSFKAERGQLLESLSHIQSIVERKNTIPVLANVKMDIKEGRLVITATDMDISISETMPVDSQTNGAITVSAHLLYEIIKKFPADSDVECSNDKDNKVLNIRAAHCDFTLPIIDAANFPVMDEVNFTHNFEIDIHDCADLFVKTHFAISTEETRYYLNGIYLHNLAEEKKLSAVSTDGHRLASLKVNLEQEFSEDWGVIIPRKTVYSLIKLMTGREGKVTIGISNTKIHFKFDTIRLVSKLIDATFPDYKRVIPNNNDIILEVSNSAFDSAVDRVSILSNDKIKAVKLSFENDLLNIHSENNDSGKASENLEAKFTDTPPEIAFNSKYILDMTSNISGEDVIFKFSKSVSPTIITDSDDDRLLYVLMPIRI